MAITSLDQLIAAPKQALSYLKTGNRTTIAAIPFSIFDVTGSPVGSLSVGNTANGIVPTDAIAGYPAINAFAGGATGYLSEVTFGSSVASRIALFDCLFSAGSYAFNASTVLTSQPSYAARLPATDYKGLEIWIETATAFTGNLSITVTYTNQDGVTGRTTGAFAPGLAPTIGRMFLMPLQLGDTGVQKIESVVSTTATVGTFNIHVMRRLWQGRVRIANDGDAHDFLKTGMPQVYADSALRVVAYADSTSSGAIELQFEIANG
jgi:hypothetical protein